MVEQIADCLLQNHMELMAEVKHLRDEVERVTANNYDRGWNDAIARAVAVLSDAVARREPASTYVAMIKNLERMKAESIGLELHEMDAIIDGNITITDSKLRDAIYAVVLDTMHTVMEKNGLMPE
jgi:hypothetical protein